ncbi:hypothetical protein QJS66_01740 [Kocuria rhizophila]|nr:hypothetical protein QJS66_01740 [Kocuria rhizophila]
MAAGRALQAAAGTCPRVVTRRRRAAPGSPAHASPTSCWEAGAPIREQIAVLPFVVGLGDGAGCRAGRVQALPGPGHASTWTPIRGPSRCSRRRPEESTREFFAGSGRCGRGGVPHCTARLSGRAPTPYGTTSAYASFLLARAGTGRVRGGCRRGPAVLLALRARASRLAGTPRGLPGAPVRGAGWSADDPQFHAATEVARAAVDRAAEPRTPPRARPCAARSCARATWSSSSSHDLAGPPHARRADPARRRARESA